MTDYSDLIKRLRERSGEYDSHNWHSDIELEAASALRMCDEKIADIEASKTYLWNLKTELEKALWVTSEQNKELKAALKPFAEDAALNTDRAEDAYPGCSKHKIRDLRRALELLEEKK